MVEASPPIPPSKLLVKKPSLCGQLEMSRSGMDKLAKRDPTFPKPIKDGNSRQATCYYVVAEVDAWIEARKAARDAANDAGSAKQ